MTAAQCKRRRRNARMDPRYAKQRGKDASVAKRRLEAMIRREQERSKRKK